MPKRIPPKPGQESVWDYPRPPKIESTNKLLQVKYEGLIIAQTNLGYRILETSHPPVYYFPPESIKMEYLQKQYGAKSHCEFKGIAEYWDISINGKVVLAAAWSYPQPHGRYKDVQDYLAFYPSKAEACFVNGELVQSQKGDFYGGWITKDIVGPFKGGVGTWGW